MTGRDYALGPSLDMDSDAVVLHRPDCPIVRAQAEAGWPVMTLYQCERSPDDLEVERCSCLELNHAA